MALKFSIFLLLIFTFNKSFSQVDSLKNKLIVSADISLGGSLNTGGLELFTMASSLKSTIDYNKLSSNTKLRYSLNNTFDNIIQNDFFGFEMISIDKKRRFHPKFAGMYEKSVVKSIHNFFAISAGLGFNILTNPKYNLVLTNSVLFEKKEFIRDQSLNYEGIRYSAILKGKYTLVNEKLILKHEFFINPDFFNLKNNYRYRLHVDLLMPISKKLSFKTSVEYSNESVVDEGFKQVNSTTVFGLSLKI